MAKKKIIGQRWNLEHTLRRCSGCNLFLATADFSPGGRRGGDGFSNYCRECARKSNRGTVERIRADPARHNKEKRRSSDYYAQHSQAIYAKHAEDRRKNPEIHRAQGHKRRAKYRGNGGFYTAEQWKAVCEAFGNQCLCCGATGISLTMDHIIPLALGGTSNIGNAQPLCGRCNAQKNMYLICDFRLRSKLIKSLSFNIYEPDEQMVATAIKRGLPPKPTPPKPTEEWLASRRALSLDGINELRLLRASGVSFPVLAAKFHISLSSAQRIAKGLNCKTIGTPMSAMVTAKPIKFKAGDRVKRPINLDARFSPIKYGTVISGRVCIDRDRNQYETYVIEWDSGAKSLRAFSTALWDMDDMYWENLLKTRRRKRRIYKSGKHVFIVNLNDPLNRLDAQPIS